MSLNHVCMFIGKSWKRVSVEDALRESHGSGISANSGLLRCQLCGHPVALAVGEINIPYFKHIDNDAVINCPEYQPGNYYQGYNTFTAENHGLPLRLMITGYNNIVKFQLGFIPIPDDDFRRVSNKTVTISKRTTGNSYSCIGTYGIKDRLNSSNITYIDVGSSPAYEYEITFKESDYVLRKYWPFHIEGVSPHGTLFDSSTKKKVPKGAEIRAGQYYILVSQNRIYPRPSVDIKHLKFNGGGKWYFYGVKATRCDRSAALFFADIGYYLSDELVYMYPIWPPYVESPYRINYSLDKMYLYYSGGDNTEIKAFPRVNIKSYPVGERNIRQRIISIGLDNSDRSQMIAAGVNSTVMKYLFFHRSELDSVKSELDVQIVDDNGHTLATDEMDSRKIRYMDIVSPEYDGHVDFMDGEFVVSRVCFKAGEDYVRLRDFNTCSDLRIYQGSDIVRIISFGKTVVQRVSVTDADTQFISDEMLFEEIRSCRGEKIDIRFMRRKILAMLRPYPKSLRFVIVNYQDGMIPVTLLRLLQSYERKGVING